MNSMFALTGFHIEGGLFSSKDHFHCLIYEGSDPFKRSSERTMRGLKEIADAALLKTSIDTSKCDIYLCGEDLKETELFGRKAAKGDLFTFLGKRDPDEKKVEALLIEIEENYSCCVILKSYDCVKDDDTVYGWIDANQSAGMGNIPGLYISSERVIPSFSEEHREENNQTCALFSLSVKGTVLPYIISGAVCLYNRFLPSSEKDLYGNYSSVFYTLNRSMTWFGSERKVLIEFDGRHISMHGEGSETDFRPNKYLAYATPFIIPLSGNTVFDILDEIDGFEKELHNSSDIPLIARSRYERFKSSKGYYSAVVSADDKKGLVSELHFLKNNLLSFFEKGEDISTPKGTFFTPYPLGFEGKIAFVYPGVGSLYHDLSRDIFQIFPEIYSGLAQVVDPSEVVSADEIYTKEIEDCNPENGGKCEKSLRRDIKSLSKSGIAFSYLYTMAALSLGIVPQTGLGYSMGEVAMFTSLGMWKDPGVLAERLASSDIFGKRLSGRMEAVKDYFKEDKGDIWGQYTVFASSLEIEKLLEDEERVFLILVNTDNEVVIAGDPESCLDFLERNNFSYFTLNISLCIHCPPAYSEYDKIAELFTLETNSEPNDIKIYSASCYLEVPKREKAVAHSIAKTFCERVDFPKLVRKTFSDGARIFIETGPRKICSQWIDEILKGESFVTIPMNVKGIEDSKTLVKAVAKLVSHGVDIDLRRFYRAY